MSNGLTRLALQALGWSYACVAIRIAVQAGAGIALAHMLGPRPFGLVAAAWALVGVGSQFVDLGFSAALVQKPAITTRDIRFAFTAQLATGCLLAAAFALLAPFVARLLHDPNLASIIRWLCPALIAQACGQTSHALLRRNLNLKTAQIAQTAGVVAGYLFIALPVAAFTQRAALSLVLGMTVQILVSSLWAYAAVRHPLTPARWPDGALASFGLKVTATNLVNWSIASLDNLVMSRAFGPTALGLYNRAQSIAVTPLATLVGVVQAVLFPALSRRNGDPQASQRAYFTSVGASMLAVLPVAAVVAVVPGPVVAGLLGEAWLPAAPLLSILACAMPWQALASLSGPLLWSRDQVQRELRIQVFVLLLLVALLAAAANRTPLAIAGCFCAVSAVRAIALWSSTGTPFVPLARALSAPLAFSLIAAASALLAERLFDGHLAAIAAFVAAGLALGAALLHGFIGFDWKLYRSVFVTASAGGPQ
jgi:PST family polysaccharide transporter